MAEFWETAFTEKQMMWGTAPSPTAIEASNQFAGLGFKNVLIPGIGYGRNAKAFLDHGMAVTGIEISETAIAFAQTQLGLQLPIYHGSVADMPFDTNQYDGIFCYGLIYLLDAEGRKKLIEDCWRQLAPGGLMFFIVTTKNAPMYGKGTRLGEDWYEPLPNLTMYFYGSEAVEREFGPFGLIEHTEFEEPTHNGATLPFIRVVCQKS